MAGTPASSWLNLCTRYHRILENGGKRASELPAAERAALVVDGAAYAAAGGDGVAGDGDGARGG